MTEEEKSKILEYVNALRAEKSEKQRIGESKCLQKFVRHIRNGDKPYITFPGVCKVDVPSKTL